MKLIKKIQCDFPLPRSPGIYAIRCAATEDTYVGGTANLFRRWCNWNCLIRSSRATQAIQVIAKKHGIESLRMEVLTACSTDRLAACELEWKDKLAPSLNPYREGWSGGRYRGEDKPTVSAQIELSDDDGLNRVSADTGRNRSYLVRAAVLLLLRQHEAGSLDWSKPVEKW